MCFPVRAVLGGAGIEGGVLTLSRPKTQEQRAQKVPLSQDGHYAQQSIQGNFLGPRLATRPLDTAARFFGYPTPSQSTLTSSAGGKA